ncbi:formylmethanofuran dehydrogenase subunit D [Sporosarcina luteola]|nr:formylmethanofuran dehydrogenase subunit D [Sporosarcina luteola]
MDKWEGNAPKVSTQRIIQAKDTFAVTLSEKMLDYLQVILGETVEVEMKDGELIIRKAQNSGASGLASSELMPPFTEPIADYPFMSDQDEGS